MCDEHERNAFPFYQLYLCEKEKLPGFQIKAYVVRMRENYSNISSSLSHLAYYKAQILIVNVKSNPQIHVGYYWKNNIVDFIVYQIIIILLTKF